MKKLLTIALAVTTLALTGCGGDNAAKTEKVIKVGASPVPHAEILEAVRPELEKDGVKLEIVEFNDYVQPNLATNDKEIDANFFQHEPYLRNFVTEHPELKLANVLGVHVEPMGIYSHKIKNINELKDGAQVSIPSDPTNGGRSLLLLERAGLIKLKAGVGETATVQDITENPKKLSFKEIEAPQLPRTLDDVDISVINTNWAMQADLVPTRDALFMEDKTSPYVNIIVVREGDENRPEIKALMKALHSDTVKNFINEKYKGAIIPAF
ncbi:MetQ/NlpA family ABC transporter substrate-binding protein [uncultured Selenomonas sp.]|uniref:MetQ/NlpA family ABC transporter substrate-binding protein n=1 Tax=uncultured Selenomonas sp. TaxID=159275 RepID=UPI0028D878A8|nr:MetQ/NlpA family ABC transporter substrate-binding protein [uncultured Selenomonas sp.]